MNKIINKLKGIETGEVATAVYSTKQHKTVTSLHNKHTVPLASAAKVAIAFCVTKWVEENKVSWEDIVYGIRFNPNEDSNELYPHLQERRSLPLRELVEVMIACHDSFAANSVVDFCGGWKAMNESIQSYYSSINLTENPRDPSNRGQLNHLHDLMINIYQGYKRQPTTWTPIMNGLVRQRGDMENIPSHHLNHMTGGLENALIDVGIIGDFNDHPYIFTVAATNLPNRSKDQCADHIIIDAMELLYNEYLHQSTQFVKGETNGKE